MAEYRNYEYVVRPGAPGKWRWSVYAPPGSAGKEVTSGEYSGSRAKAVQKAKAAIDRLPLRGPDPR
jgi:hypothetical protein